MKVETLQDYAQIGPWLLDKTDVYSPGRLWEIIDENVKAPDNCD